jgi:hypothetical protein
MEINNAATAMRRAGFILQPLDCDLETGGSLLRGWVDVNDIWVGSFQSGTGYDAKRG